MSLATDVFSLIRSHLVAGLVHSNTEISITNPGHGNDQVCPIVVYGNPFDPQSSSDVDPFTPAEVIGGRDSGGTYQDGAGWIAFDVTPAGESDLISAGDPPERSQPMTFTAHSLAAADAGRERGVELLEAVSTLFRDAFLQGASGSPVSYIEARNGSPEMPRFVGQGGGFNEHQITIRLDVVHRAPLTN